MSLLSEVPCAVCDCPIGAVSASIAKLQKGCCACVKMSIKDHRDIRFGKNVLVGCLYWCGGMKPEHRSSGDARGCGAGEAVSQVK